MRELKEINAEKTLQKLAAKKGVTVEDVRRQISLAMLVGMCDPDPNIQAYWHSIPHTGDIPTPEEIIVFLSNEVNNRRK